MFGVVAGYSTSTSGPRCQISRSITGRVGEKRLGRRVKPHQTTGKGKSSEVKGRLFRMDGGTKANIIIRQDPVRSA